MKRILKIASLFLFVFVGNSFMSSAQRTILVTEGEDVYFDLVGVFHNGKRENKIVKVWVDDPLFGKTSLTNISKYVLLSVQRE